MAVVLSELKMLLLTALVLIVNAHNTHGQAYLFSLEGFRNPNVFLNQTNTSVLEETEQNNTKIIVFKNTVVEKSNELSQTAMDVITIVWYVATFLALAAFFMLMACSDRRCRDTQTQQTTNANEAPLPPPTPSPSYSEFAPPSYETVIKMQHAAKTSIFVIPFAAVEMGQNKNDESTNNNTNINANQIQMPSTPINVYTINELQKTNS